MTLGLIFKHFPPKTHFGAFSVFHTKYGVIFEDKKIQTQKWCIWEKFRHQKLGVTKGFYLVKFFSFLISATFWKNDCSATWKPNSFKKNLACGQLRNVQRYQKHVLLVWSFIFRVSYMLEPTVIPKYSYVHMKPLLSMFMKGNEVTLRERNQS